MSTYVVRTLLRSPAQTLVRIVVLAASAALLGALVLFVGRSLQTMTRGAVAAVPIAWQGPVGSEPAARSVAARVAREHGVRAAFPLATAPYLSTEARGPAGVIQGGGGRIVAFAPHDRRALGAVRLLYGRMREGAVVLDQQLAATLQAKVGDTVRIALVAHRAPVALPVSGIAIVGSTDVLFQPLDPLVGPAPAQPPSNVVVMPLDTFAARVATQLAAVPAATPAAAAVPGAARGVSWQVVAQVAPAALAGSPRHAYDAANRLRNRVERDLPGRITFVDNLADGLSTAAGDALYAEALFVMLGVPGALIGLGLVYLAALGAVERDRRGLFLLHARGASRRRLLAVALVESAVLAAVAGAIGAGAAVAVTRLVVGGPLPSWVWSLPTCFGLAFVGALTARLVAGLAGAERTARETPPLWQRLWLDVIALGVSGLVYWLTARTGFSAVINPDSNPTLSLSVYMFLAPACLWLGSALLLVRLKGGVLRRLAPARAASRGGYLLASAARRAAVLNRGLVVVALLLAFAVDLAIFSATYDQQARVDAQLTLGADVVAAGAPGVQAVVAGVPGVAGTTSLTHTYAYVGPDLQDTFGIDPASFTRGTALRDSYFVGGTAAQMLGRLRARPDAILVSKETVTDYSLSLGDLLKLRTLDRSTGRFHVTPFHVVGVVQEFPSAPRDSFMVANLHYLLAATHGAGPNVVFAKVSGDPRAVARRVAAATRARGAVVKNIEDQALQTVSSITTVDLRGISRIELAFAVLLVVAALVLYVGVALVERRQEFATMAALGKRPGTIVSFIWSELAVIVVASALLAALLGWLLAEMLVAMLQHAFDPPPDHLAVPWAAFLELAGAAVGGAALATAVAVVVVRRLPLGVVLREE